MTHRFGDDSVPPTLGRPGSRVAAASNRSLHTGVNKTEHRRVASGGFCMPKLLMITVEALCGGRRVGVVGGGAGGGQFFVLEHRRAYAASQHWLCDSTLSERISFSQF